MLNNGANPYICNYNGNSSVHHLRRAGYEIDMKQRSVYFTTQPLFGTNPGFLHPWFYKTGVFNGNFDLEKPLGEGSAGIVIKGEWAGKKAAFKFVDIGKQQQLGHAKYSLEILGKKLSEMNEIQSTKGSRILSFYGHYR